SYSAEDLVVVQRDIGRLAQYTMEMGGSIDLLALTLKIPPWEPMKTLSREELRSTQLVNAVDYDEIPTSVVASASALGSGMHNDSNDKGWVLVRNAGQPVIVRRHPLTVEGETVGAFDLTFACAAGGQYAVTYAEELKTPESGAALKLPRNIRLKVADRSVALK